MRRVEQRKKPQAKTQKIQQQKKNQKTESQFSLRHSKVLIKLIIKQKTKNVWNLNYNEKKSLFCIPKDKQVSCRKRVFNIWEEVIRHTFFLIFYFYSESRTCVEPTIFDTRLYLLYFLLFLSKIHLIIHLRKVFFFSISYE